MNFFLQKDFILFICGLFLKALLIFLGYYQINLIKNINIKIYKKKNKSSRAVDNSVESKNNESLWVADNSAEGINNGSLGCADNSQQGINNGRFWNADNYHQERSQ